MIEKIKKVLEQIAEKENTPTLDVVLANFETAILITKDEDPSLEGEKLERRALTLLKEYINKQIYSKGKPFTFLNFGVLFAPKDKNKILRDKILKDWKDPGKRTGMIRQGKVMFMRIGEDKVPIKSYDVKDTHEEKSGDFTVLIIDKGEPCDLGAGDMPLPRDSRKKIKYANSDETYDNINQYSKQLTPNWSMTLQGVGFFDGLKKVKNENEEIIEVEKTIKDSIKARVQIFGALANPHSEHFLGKELIWFMPLKFDATENTRSNALVLQVTGKGTFTLGLKDINVEKVVKYLNTKFSKMYEAWHDRAKKMRDKATIDKDEDLMKKAKETLKTANLFKPYVTKKKYIPIIDLVEIEDFHYAYAVQYKENDDGEMVLDKNKSGWDNTDYDAFALCRCAYTGFFTKTGKKPKMMLTDWSVPDTLFVGFVPILKTDIENGEVYVCLGTSRSDSVYDESTGKYVKDPEEATPFPKIKGIKLVKSLKGITKKYEAKLEGDM